MELVAMSFACRELGNRKRQKIGNLSNYMKDADDKLQALTEAVARLEQRAWTFAAPSREAYVPSPPIAQAAEPEMAHVWEMG